MKKKTHPKRSRWRCRWRYNPLRLRLPLRPPWCLLGTRTQVVEWHSFRWYRHYLSPGATGNPLRWWHCCTRQCSSQWLDSHYLRSTDGKTHVKGQISVGFIYILHSYILYSLSIHALETLSRDTLSRHSLETLSRDTPRDTPETPETPPKNSWYILEKFSIHIPYIFDIICSILYILYIIY